MKSSRINLMIDMINTSLFSICIIFMMLKSFNSMSFKFGISIFISFIDSMLLSLTLLMKSISFIIHSNHTLLLNIHFVLIFFIFKFNFRNIYIYCAHYWLILWILKYLLSLNFINQRTYVFPDILFFEIMTNVCDFKVFWILLTVSLMFYWLNFSFCLLQFIRSLQTIFANLMSLIIHYILKVYILQIWCFFSLDHLSSLNMIHSLFVSTSMIFC